ncbi:hypothetical protein CQA38_04830 [Campylobacter sp. MIT 12-5580]|uniref:hypothetical protein n=1 Tax=Campylobacter sp. MIT 12-5580 TaxID=2040651 RepID=UPI0010F4DA3E|nr:hypothetical protein [Campylobacter sp. MIT 12-5580]TKX29408.1 hypothetical protein CQA38_04830 [Campylobacter sp. MIT 12-5580]
MSEKLSFYLDGLSLREKILLGVISLLLGAFLGLKLAQILSFWYYDPQNLERFSNEQGQILKLSSLKEEQKLNLNELEKTLLKFKIPYQKQLDELYKLANAKHIHFHSIKDKKIEKEYFISYKLELEFEAEFMKTMQFLKALEQTNIGLKGLNLVKDQDKKGLKVMIYLDLLVLKAY